MSRSRARDKVAVRHSFGFALILACRSIRSESWGIWVVSFYMGVELGYTGTFRYDGAPWLRGRWQVVTVLSVPCNPPCPGIV